MLLLGAQRELEKTWDNHIFDIHRKLSSSIKFGYVAVSEKYKSKAAAATPIAFLISQVQSLLHVVRLFCQNHSNYEVANVLNYLALNPAQIARFYR